MKQFVLKSGNTETSVTEDIFSTNPFEIEYNINYQGDDFADIDFSNNEYPILIDQPEDDLDAHLRESRGCVIVSRNKGGQHFLLELRQIDGEIFFFVSPFFFTSAMLLVWRL